jgi:hypothetical protein
MASYLAAYAEKITALLVATIVEQAELIGELKTRLAALEAPKSAPVTVGAHPGASGGA